MDPLLVVVAIALTGAFALGALYIYQATILPRRIARDRILSGAEQADVLPRSALRARRGSRLPFVDRLPLSKEARTRMEEELEKAGSPMRVPEYLFVRIGVAALAGLAGLVLVSRLGDPPGWVLVIVPLALVVPGWTAPSLYVARLQRKREIQIESQLPDALTAISKALRSGSGLLQALAYAATETPAPLGAELQHTLRDLQLGGDTEQVFTNLSERVGNADLDIAVTAILIQRTVGGNLSEILNNVTSTIRERVKLHSEIRVLTARQRLTGNLVAALPVLVAIAFIGLNPDTGKLLFNNNAGRVALAIGIGFEILGLALIRKLESVEY